MPTKTTKKESSKKNLSEGALSAKVYGNDGKETGSIALPENIFGLSWNPDLVHQVTTSYMSNRRNPVAHTKDRSEVRGGGKKPWQQKGTGRARHGSSRSPIWIGGGVTFGPLKDKNFDRKINKKMRVKALFTVLSKKYKDGEVFFVDNISVSEPKTALAKKALLGISKTAGLEGLLSKKKNSAAVLLSKKDNGLERAFANFSNIEVGDIRNTNILDVLAVKNVIIAKPEDSLKILSSKIK
jgi:large subunit ribosomal protein L4